MSKKVSNYLYILGFIVVLIVAIVIIFKTDENKEPSFKPYEFDESNPDLCDCVIIDGAKKIKIIAHNKEGTNGGIYSAPAPYERYLIKRTEIGDIYNVNYQCSGGDASRYDCNEDWYSITLPDGREAFVRGGTESAYVEILE